MNIQSTCGCANKIYRLTTGRITFRNWSTFFGRSTFFGEVDSLESCDFLHYVTSSRPSFLSYSISINTHTITLKRYILCIRHDKTSSCCPPIYPSSLSSPALLHSTPVKARLPTNSNPALSVETDRPATIHWQIVKHRDIFQLA
jgi:hypothetical protein